MATLDNAVHSFWLSNPKFIAPGINSSHSIQSASLANGDNDIYTVPTGKKFLFGRVGFYNASGGSITCYPEVKIGGTYYRVGANAAVGNNTFNAPVVVAPNLVLSAGQVLAVNTNAAGINLVYITGYEFDAGIPLTTTFTTSFSAGDNTVYTCPSGKTAVLSTTTAAAVSNGLRYYNSSGGTRTIYANQVLSGGSPSTTNQCWDAEAVTNNNNTVIELTNVLSAGDFINLNVDANTATQYCWITAYEY